MRQHAIITGTGRAGTTFLVKLLTHLKLDTGYLYEEIEELIGKSSRAGLEQGIDSENAPYIIKRPSFCTYARDVLDKPDISIDHVFVPVRDINDAVKSRKKVETETKRDWSLKQRLVDKFYRKISVEGGLVYTKEKDGQEKALYEAIYNLIYELSKEQIPLTFMEFPRIVNDSKYLYEKLKPILKNISFEEFDVSFTAVANKKSVSKF